MPRRRLLINNKPQLMNVAMYELSTGQLFQTPNPTLFSSKLYEPIGIVVIPTKHDVYGTGECGIVALKEPSLTSPDSGGMNYGYIVTKDDSTISGIPTFTNCSRVQKNNNTYLSYSDLYNDTDYCYMPSDKETFSYKDSLRDQFSSYYYNHTFVIPSPYNKDESFNSLEYGIKEIDGVKNCMSDFDGKEHTKIMCNLETYQPNWKTDSKILEYCDYTHFPYALCCWRYNTIGTNQGDWYIPSIGELGYIIARLNQIRNVMKVLNYDYSNSIFEQVINMMSSSQYNYRFMIGITNLGNVTRIAKSYSYANTFMFTRKILPVRLKP